MRPLSFKRRRFPAEVIRHAAWLYFRYALSFRDVEEMLAQRGVEVSYETIRCWTIKFGPQIARNLKRKRTTRLALARKSRVLARAPLVRRWPAGEHA